ncbi:transcription antitermination protein NusB [Geitlerinema sp. P-1104]|uniref:transcription antitermination factor NusB n=1 Tax=Geitlerinema sp. P-1104 TaxID=2546230 RepID=UPI0014769B33|nr:transcription antitermination factor NusB [Geitlerinema sp. P-1104]NMG58014.1 transcription antitermination protein NusB [Geitlerinema sp. P-1104]
MQARSISRELALLSLSQLPKRSTKLSQQQLSDFIVAAVRAMTLEVHESLETAAAELKRGYDRLMEQELRDSDITSSKASLTEAMELTRHAIDRLGMAIELPEFVQLANQTEVQEYALELLLQVTQNRQEIDQFLDRTIVDWQLERLPHVEQNILRLATAELCYVGTPDQIAINEAVELTKRYSSEKAHRFVNGVLRRLVELRDRPEETPAQSTSDAIASDNPAGL